MCGAAVLVVGVAACNALADDAPQSHDHAQTVTIEVEDGAVQGDPGLTSFELGDHVVLHVSADVADEVHVHGYDIMRDIEPGETATIEFEADIPGRFDAELEGRHLTLLEFEVR